MWVDLVASWGHIESLRAAWVLFLTHEYLVDFQVVAGGGRQPLGPPRPKTQNLMTPLPVLVICALRAAMGR